MIFSLSSSAIAEENDSEIIATGSETTSLVLSPTETLVTHTPEIPVTMNITGSHTDTLTFFSNADSINISISSIPIITDVNTSIIENKTLTIDSTPTETFTIVNTPTQVNEVSSSISSSQGEGMAIGNETSVQVYTQSDTTMSYSLTISKAEASNGSKAIAESESQSNFLGNSISYAKATAIAISNIGKTIWVYAISFTFSSKDTSSAQSISVIANQNIDTHKFANNTLFPLSNITNPSTLSLSLTSDNTSNLTSLQTTSIQESGKPEKIKIKIYNQGSLSGYTYGSGSTERYCIQMLQSDSNNETISKHASYQIDVIATVDENERNTSAFEVKYNITKNNCIELLTNDTI